MSAFQKLFGETLTTKDGPKPTDEVLNGKTAVGIYFSAHWCPPCRGFTPKLAEAYNDHLEEKGFEIVFVSSDKNQEAFDGYYGEMPWVSLPFENRDQKDVLSKKFKVRGIPSFVILDPQGNTITDKGRECITSDPKGAEYPWMPKPLKELLGTEFQGKDGEKISMESLDNKIIGLYFSAHWCPPCRAFTPKLIECYNKLQEQGKNFEVIFCSSDRDENQFKEYYNEMPWKCVPFEDRKRKADLGNHFDVQGIPSLIILDENREVINASAVGTVANSGVEAFPWAPEAVSDINVDPEGIDEAPSIVVLMENASADKQKEIKAWMKEVASPYMEKAKKTGDDQEHFFFVAAKEGGLSDRVRDECHVEDEDKGLACVLMDIQDNGGYYPGPMGDAICKESVEQLLADFQAKKLKREQMG